MATMRRWASRCWHEERRLLPWVCLLLGSVAALEWLGLDEFSRWRLVWHKVNLVSLGAILAHVAWEFLVPYYDMGREMGRVVRSKGKETDTAILFLGVAIFRGLFYAAVIVGLVYGL